MHACPGRSRVPNGRESVGKRGSSGCERREAGPARGRTRAVCVHVRPRQSILRTYLQQWSSALLGRDVGLRLSFASYQQGLDFRNFIAQELQLHLRATGLRCDPSSRSIDLNLGEATAPITFPRQRHGSRAERARRLPRERK